jgi:methionyl aminopeptidase
LYDAGAIAAMREAGRLAALTLAHLKPYIRPGVATGELNTLAETFIRGHGAEPTFLNYGADRAGVAFPASICASINDEAVHGIPSPQRRLHSGDLLSLDVGVTYGGWVADTACTYAVGEIEAEAQRLLRACEAALWAGIDQARAGNHLGDIGAAIQQSVEGAGCTVLRELTGHGIGREMHQAPTVLNHGRAGAGMRLQSGMTLAIEVAIGAGGWRTSTDADGWTTRTADGSLSAHCEHTIAITAGPAHILTLV